MQESEHKSNCNAKYSKLQAEVNELEKIISCGNDDTNLSHGINHSLYNSLERLNSAKRVRFHHYLQVLIKHEPQLGPLLLSLGFYLSLYGWMQFHISALPSSILLLLHVSFFKLPWSIITSFCIPPQSYLCCCSNKMCATFCGY